MARMSIATIDKPEFINLKPLEINPLMSSCEIKVLYIGENRNKSFITKEVATEMSKTLRGAPIVGWYKEDKKDFMDHGDRVIFDGEGMKFECMTRPYGFVAPDAKVWFQKFEDTDDFGNKIIREYLMTTGYLWTGQYEEAKSAVEGNGKPHSMELDKDTLDGKWSQNLKTGMEFFIINDAIFSKLCILGNDIEPCFEGSSITAPNVSKTFTKVDDKFINTLFSMMQDLKFALEGGQKMDNVQGATPAVETPVTPTENFSAEQGKDEKASINGNQNFTEDSTSQVNLTPEFKKDEQEEEKKEEGKDTASKPGEEKPAEEEDDKKKKKEEYACGGKDDEDEKKKYSLLEQKYSELEQKYANLSSEYQSLVEFKNQIENEKKDNLIKSFYMLSDDDKKDVVENKAKYSLDEIESKLSVICVRKKVNFDLDTNDKNDTKVESENTAPATTYNLPNNAGSVPAWISALRNTQNSRNN